MDMHDSSTHTLLSLPDRHIYRRTIDETHTVPQLLPGSVLAERGEPVLATAVMIALCEDATWEAITPHIPPHLAILGTRGRYEHLAPTAPGQTLEITVVCTRITPRSQLWTAVVTNMDTGRLAGVLHHDLTTIDRTTLQQRLDQP